MNNKNVNNVCNMFLQPIDIISLNRIKCRLLNHSNDILTQFHLSSVQRNLFFNSLYKDNIINKPKLDVIILEKDSKIVYMFNSDKIYTKNNIFTCFVLSECKMLKLFDEVFLNSIVYIDFFMYYNYNNPCTLR